MSQSFATPSEVIALLGREWQPLSANEIAIYFDCPIEWIWARLAYLWTHGKIEPVQSFRYRTELVDTTRWECTRAALAESKECTLAELAEVKLSPVLLDKNHHAKERPLKSQVYRQRFESRFSAIVIKPKHRIRNSPLRWAKLAAIIQLEHALCGEDDWGEFGEF